MKKHSILRYGLVLAALLAAALALYFCFWHIPKSEFQYIEGKGHCISPTGEYLLDYSVYHKERAGEVRGDSPTYFICTLISQPEYSEDGTAVHWNWKHSKTIYYEKDAADFQAEWVSGDTVEINGRRLRVPWETYDYRRDWK